MANTLTMGDLAAVLRAGRGIEQALLDRNTGDLAGDLIRLMRCADPTGAVAARLREVANDPARTLALADALIALGSAAKHIARAEIAIQTAPSEG